MHVALAPSPFETATAWPPQDEGDFELGHLILRSSRRLRLEGWGDRRATEAADG